MADKIGERAEPWPTLTLVLKGSNTKLFHA